MSLSELTLRIASELSTFEESDHALWGQLRRTPYRASISRSEADGKESVFVVAQVGARVIYFDDVEDEWAGGEVGISGELQECGLYGDLRNAIRIFGENAA